MKLFGLLGRVLGGMLGYPQGWQPAVVEPLEMTMAYDVRVWFVQLCMGALGGIGIVFSLQAARFGTWIRMLWASGATFRYVLVVARSWGHNDWFWYQALAWPSPGYINGTVLTSSCGAWSSWSSNNVVYIEQGPDWVHSQIFLDIILYLSSSQIWPTVAPLIHSSPCSSLYKPISQFFPCKSLGRPMSLSS